MTDGVAKLTDGEYRMRYLPDAATELIVNLGYARSFADLDEDGDEDAIVFLVVDPGGSGTFHYMVAVLNDGGISTPVTPEFLGDRVFVRSAGIESGEILVEIATHGPETPFCCLDTISERTYSLKDRSLRLERQIDSPMTDAGDLPFSAPKTIEFAPSANSASVAGRIALNQVDRYQFGARAGQRITVTTSSAKDDVFLSIRGLEDGVVLQSILAEATVFSGDLSKTQEYGVSLVTPQGSPVDYLLRVEIAGGPQPTPTASPSLVPTATPTPTASPPTPTLPPAGRVIYFTFDDGQASVYTVQILDLLARYDARATFFILGQHLSRYPEIRQAQVSAGHTLANHTWDHVNLDGIDRARFLDEIVKTQEILGADATPCLRPPYGASDAFTRVWAEEIGMRIVMWDIDTRDWARPGVEEIAASIISSARPGAVVLMHDGGGDRSQTVAALEVALRDLSEQGYRFEPVCP
jgi:peptidoglycan/xylan/chitin deacetylase (PgdA/CDA1 family)